METEIAAITITMLTSLPSTPAVTIADGVGVKVGCALQIGVVTIVSVPLQTPGQISPGPPVVVGTAIVLEVNVSSPGHQVVYEVIISVVSCPTGQSVMVTGHEVTVYVLVR